jgi:CheY-like chemotaxis protein
VLVVDDHADSADSLSLIIQHLGHEVKTAYDSKAAIALARDFRPEIVFCDLGLPVMDGYEVARQLRNTPDTRGAILVALTGYGRDEDKKRSGSAGFDYHLVKPVSPESLEEMLELSSRKHPGPPSSPG